MGGTRSLKKELGFSKTRGRLGIRLVWSEERRGDVTVRERMEFRKPATKTITWEEGEKCNDRGRRNPRRPGWTNEIYLLVREIEE